MLIASVQVQDRNGGNGLDSSAASLDRSPVFGIEVEKDRIETLAPEPPESVRQPADLNDVDRRHQHPDRLDHPRQLERDPHQVSRFAGEADQAGIVLEQAQGMLSWRMDKAERRLTGCKSTPSGLVGAI